jgi:hypothetical protein
MTTKEAIVLLYPPHNQSRAQMTKALADCCKENNLSIIDMIEIKDLQGSEALDKLIKNILEQNKQVAFIGNQSIATEHEEEARSFRLL